MDNPYESTKTTKPIKRKFTFPKYEFYFFTITFVIANTASIKYMDFWGFEREYGYMALGTVLWFIAPFLVIFIISTTIFPFSKMSFKELFHRTSKYVFIVVGALLLLLVARMVWVLLRM